MSKKPVYATPKGDKQCLPHRLGLAKDGKAHIWTERAENWRCRGYEDESQ